MIHRHEIIAFCETAFRNLPEGTDFLPIINALDDGRGFETALNKIGFRRGASESMDVNSPEAALWSENMSLKSQNEYFRAILTGIAVMDVYTRPGEKPASEVMRASAKEALEKHP